jgi:hypothetical protein
MSKSWFEVQSIIVEKAMRDEQYRRRLLEDPIRVAEEERGEKLPESVRIKVIEFDPETRYILLRPRSAQDERPDSALEQVAGGAGVLPSTPPKRGGPVSSYRMDRPSVIER